MRHLRRSQKKTRRENAKYSYYTKNSSVGEGLSELYPEQRFLAGEFLCFLKNTSLHHKQNVDCNCKCDKEEYEGLLETINMLMNTKAVKEIEESLKELKNDAVYSFEDVAGRKQKK